MHKKLFNHMQILQLTNRSTNHHHILSAPTTPPLPVKKTGEENHSAVNKNFS